MPASASLDTAGLTLPRQALDTLLSVDPGEWAREAALIPAWLETFGSHLPGALHDEYKALLRRLNGATHPADPGPAPKTLETAPFCYL